MFIPGPDLVTRAAATVSHYLMLNRYTQTKSLTLRQGGPVIPGPDLPRNA